MKKYFMSHIDFSEIVNLTVDPAQLERARERMNELGLLTEKGNPSVSQISSLSTHTAGDFLQKLRKRIGRRTGGITAVCEIFRKLADKKEYHAMFLYLAFLYGFVEWQTPEKIALLPASPEALKCFMTQFVSDFEAFLNQEESVPTFQEKPAIVDDGE